MKASPVLIVGVGCLVVLICAILVLGVLVLARPSAAPTSVASEPLGTRRPTTLTPSKSGPVSGVPGALPDMPQKPQPKEIASFQGCPPEGDGSDPELNRLKNRVDEGSYVPVTFDAIAKLTWPKTIERRRRADWSSADAAAIHKYEGIPVVVEGYLAGAKEEGPEATNCHGADLGMHDFHIWMTQNAGEDRSTSVVIETTPRVRTNHPTWTVQAIEKVARDKRRVRISGWLMMDPEHPDQVGNTRGTIWEIHPIMQIEVQEGGAFKPL